MQAESEITEIDAHAKEPSSIPNGLYVIATPIGNLGDITYRAVSILKSVNIVACEDTRVTARLLDHYNIKATTIAYHEHSGPTARPKLLKALNSGQSIALVSDAGTPLLADPGYKLVQEAAAYGYTIFSVPGPSSITSALSIAGLPTDRHYFEGFLPNRQGERKRRLQALAGIDATLVMLESPHRILDCLEDAQTTLGDRPAALARELTKRFEEVLRGTLSSIRSELEARSSIKGEIVLMIDRSNIRNELSDAELDQKISTALLENKPSKTAAIISKETGIDRDTIYKRVLALKPS